MFGYVSRPEFEAERERRIRAEAEAEAARLQAARLLDLVNDLLDRLHPKAPAAGFGLPPGVALPGPVSATEIFKIPAIGKRGVRERNAAARDAELREERDTKEQVIQQRRATLTPEEQALLDQQIPR